MTVDSVKYFAYGSNLDPVQLSQRCPSARKLCVALLRDRALDFPRHSAQRKGGVADARAQAGGEVWGVVFEMLRADMEERLDVCEGYQPTRPPEQKAYNRTSCTVRIDGDPDKPFKAETYFATRRGQYVPHWTYMALIYCGARYWGLPDAYVTKLEQMPVTS